MKLSNRIEFENTRLESFYRGGYLSEAEYRPARDRVRAAKSNEAVEAALSTIKYQMPPKPESASAWPEVVYFEPTPKEVFIELQGFKKRIASLKAQGKKLGAENQEKMRALRKRINKSGSLNAKKYVCQVGDDKQEFSGKDALKRLSERLLKLRTEVSHRRGLARQNAKPLIKERVLDKYLTKKVRATKIFDDRTPDSPTDHVGIELECVTTLSLEKLAAQFLKAGLEKSVTVASDGSLRVSRRGDTVAEVKVLAKVKDVDSVITQVCAVLKAAGGYVNPTCGLHVHLDMRTKKVQDCYKSLVYCQDALFKLLPHSRRHNKYAQRNPYSTNIAGMREERYLAINPHAYKRHKTLEVRMHQGTINPEVIKAWVALLHAICKEGVTNRVRTLQGLLGKVNLPRATATYLVARSAEMEEREFDPENIPNLSESNEARANRVSKTHGSCTCQTCGETGPTALAQTTTDDAFFDFQEPEDEEESEDEEDEDDY